MKPILKITIEGSYVSKIYIAQIIKTGLGRIGQFEDIEIVDEYVGELEPIDEQRFIIVKNDNPFISR